VELAELQTRIDTEFPGAILEKQAFGRGGTCALWVNAASLVNVGKIVFSEGFTWLEAVTAVQMPTEDDDAFVLTYILRPPLDPRPASVLLLRISVIRKKGDKTDDEVDAPSVVRLWSAAESYEQELSELFGIRFWDAGGMVSYQKGLRLPHGLRGYPLRKNFIFPTHVNGIAHSRARPDPDGNLLANDQMAGPHLQIHGESISDRNRRPQ
jgi:NADH:ubiquinone oxidoreductase subunit C